MTRPFPLTAVRRTAGLVRRAATRLGTRSDRGQATAEYGLIILAAGGIALGVIAWASGTGTFTDMFEAVVDKLSENL
jgi:Flp pilus assembly pilin Flp